MPISRDGLLAIFEALDYHVAIYDHAWRYVYVNAAAAQMLRRAPTDLIGHSIWELFPEAVGNQFHREVHEAAASGRPVHSDHFYPPFDRWFENHIYPIPDGLIVLSRDITAQKAAAVELERREQVQRLAQRAGGVATFEWDFINQMAECSAQFFRILGLPERDGVISVEEWGRYVHPDDRAFMSAHLTRVLDGSEPAAADYRIIRGDGTVRWLSYAGQLQTTARGPALVGAVVDVTDRKALEAELRRQATEVERILDSIGEGFVALDRQARYVYVNRAAEQMFGRSRADLLGRTPWDVFPDAMVHDVRDQIEAVLADGVMRRFEAHVPEWSRWYENRVYASEVGVSIFFADVTARVAAESALRESRDVLALAMRSGSMGAWSRNLVTNDVWWSRELEEIFGLPPGGFSRTEASFFEFVHADDRPAVRDAVAAAVAGGTDYVVEFRFHHASGELRWMEGRGRAVYAPDDGVPQTLYGIGIDVTARKQVELALARAKESAEAANRVKDQFLATLSHELRTPLNVILGYARMLRHDDLPPGKRQQMVEVIERNAVVQNRLVDDLLDMSRIASGKMPLTLQPTPIEPVVTAAIDGIRLAAEEKGVAVSLVIGDAVGAVTADAMRLQQVFGNLLSNAVKFTGSGGTVRVSIRGDGESVEARVDDTGAGIAPEFLPLIFEPFRQADARFSRGHGGLGLGLAICRQLVELQGGSIAAASPGLGQGATFTVRLPAASLQPTDILPPAPPLNPQAVSSGELLRDVDIVLVEDSPDTLTMFREALEAAGARVRAVPTAAEAIREVERDRPDLLVTDLGLPHADGYALLSAVRSLGDCALLPVVAVTAYARPDDRERALAAGFHAHIAKPIDPDTLVRTLAAVVA